MIKKSRLRTQKKEGRRVIFSLLIIAILGVAGYQLEQHFGITTSIKGVLHSIRVTFSQQGPVRGTIYDRNLKQLAVNLERVSVYVRSREIDSIAETATRLSEVLALDKNKLEEQLESGVLRLWIAENISQEQEIALKKLKMPGVYLQRDEKRYYPNDSQAAYIIGAGENGIGLSGVEFYYDRLLAGRKIKQQGKEPPLGSSFDLVLTIDMKIQEILESLVRDIARSEKADKVALYLMESETGEIIGGANLPGFNPNTYAKYSQEQTQDLFLNRYQCLKNLDFFCGMQQWCRRMVRIRSVPPPGVWSPIKTVSAASCRSGNGWAWRIPRLQISMCLPNRKKRP